MDILKEISSFKISKNVCGKVINSHINDKNPFIELRLFMLLSKISNVIACHEYFKGNLYF